MCSACDCLQGAAIAGMKNAHRFFQDDVTNPFSVLVISFVSYFEVLTTPCPAGGKTATAAVVSTWGTASTMPTIWRC